MTKFESVQVGSCFGITDYSEVAREMVTDLYQVIKRTPSMVTVKPINHAYGFGKSEIRCKIHGTEENPYIILCGGPMARFRG